MKQVKQAEWNTFRARQAFLAGKALRYGRGELFWYSAPGRVEVLGNHTDHQGGKVLVGAVTRDILAAVQRREDDVVEIHSDGFRVIRVSLQDTAPRLLERGKSISMVRGVLQEMKRHGPVHGFTAHTHSTIPRGAGISSSAAFELLLVEIVNDLFQKNRLSAWEKAVVAQRVENNYFGKPCGILDQAGIAMGGLSKMDFFDYKHPRMEKVPMLQGYSFVLTHTGGTHGRLREEYASIPREMKQVASFFRRDRLAQVPQTEFLNSISDLRKSGVSDRAILRAFHFYAETERVDQAAAALNKQDAEGFLQLVKASGRSSWELLQNCYVSDSTSQPICIALTVSAQCLQCGAVRIHGGGFAGSVLAVVKDGEKKQYQEKMSRLFGQENVFTVQICDKGVRRLEV